MVFQTSIFCSRIGITCVHRWLRLFFIVAPLTAGCLPESANSEYPSRTIKVIVPFSAGGGSDAFARVVKRAVEENKLLPQSLVIINVGGASGTIGSRRVKNARPDGYTTLLLHDALVMAKHSGKANYGPEAFEAVAGTSQIGLVIAARQDSPFRDVRMAVEEALDKPDTVTFGCNLGTPTHFVGLLLEQERPGAAFRYVQTGDGAQRFAALKGGHIDLTVFSTEEFLRYRPQGIRALASFDNSRHPAMPDVQTACELGFDAHVNIMQYWWMPKGTPPDRIAVLATALDRALKTEQVRAWLEISHSQPVFTSGIKLDRRLEHLEDIVGSVELRHKVDMPNFPAYVAMGLGGCGGLIALRRLRTPQTSIRGDQKATWERYRRIIVCAAAVLAYAFVLSLNGRSVTVGFRPATFLFVMTVGLCLSRDRRRSFAWLVALSVVMSLGLHFVFTYVLVIDLP